MQETAPLSSTGIGPRTWFRRIGALGALLALIILGASILLRLTSVLDPQGHASSTLAAPLEQAIRLLHRLCASGVALLALCAVVLCWKQRKAAPPRMTQAVLWIVAATLILALIGPLTPGYRLAGVTVVNVLCGVLLLLSFWWLRESAAPGSVAGPPLEAFSWVAMVALLLQVGTGAAASAWAMHAVHWPARVHLASALLCLILVGVVLLDQRSKRAPDGRRWVVGLLLSGQFLLGYLLMWQEQRSITLSFFHAMLAPLLAGALVSLLRRQS
ncbi:MAG: hypothetical protein WCJ76_17335 [Comamonadaceae bacterium]